MCLVSFIYIDPFFKLDRTVAGQSSTKGSRTSNSRGIGGILRCRGPRSERRILSGGCTASGTVKEMYICMKLVCVPFERCIYREVVVQARRMRLCNIFVTMLCNSASFMEKNTIRPGRRRPGGWTRECGRHLTRRARGATGGRAAGHAAGGLSGRQAGRWGRGRIGFFSFLHCPNTKSIFCRGTKSAQILPRQRNISPGSY